jgi:hypothetical protein
MKTYEVIVTRDTTESTVIQVMADSPEAAEAEALAESRKGRYVWEQDDTPNASAEHYVTGVQEGGE